MERSDFDFQLLDFPDDIHRHLTGEVVGKKLELSVLRDWTTKLELTIFPVMSPG